MKNIRLTVVMAAIMATFSGIVIFSSCSKTTCSNIVCRNGGICSDGKCTCPTGYTGSLCQFAASGVIQYVNNTFTPISISVNGEDKVIPVGGNVYYSGQFGTNALGSATTSGSATSLGITSDGGKIGIPINWSIDNTFPAADTLRVPLDVGATYFFLKMANKRNANILNYYVNVNFTNYPEATTFEHITVPNNGVTYNMGYYLAYVGSNVQVQTSNSAVVWKAVSVPFTSNQSATITID